VELIEENEVQERNPCEFKRRSLRLLAQVKMDYHYRDWWIEMEWKKRRSK
jgi:hypothetical protein